jgi:hypothetical protein
MSGTLVVALNACRDYCSDDALCAVWCFDMLFLLGHAFGASGVPQLLGCSAVGV